MTKDPFLQTISGADKFQLLLDEHIRRNQSTGNVIRLSIELEGRITVSQLQESISSNAFLAEINSLEIVGKLWQMPKWKKGERNKPVVVTEHAVSEDKHLPDEVLLRDIKVNSGTLLHIDLVQGKENSTVVISAHHVLADNQGIQSIAKIIAGNAAGELSTAFTSEVEKTSLLQQLIHTLKATFFVFGKSPGRLSKLKGMQAETKHHVIRFTAEETQAIDEIAVKNGAALSKSSFYLTVTSMVLSRFIFKHTGLKFFLPVPQNQRLRGDEKVRMGNQLSFLFYNIPFLRLESLSDATSCITEQLKKQAKDQMPVSYALLLKTFRFLPLSIYNFFFKLPTNGAVSSFLFSDVGETLPELKTFFGKKVVEVLNYAPNPCPPHITFVYMKHEGALKITISYNSLIIPYEQIDRFERSLRLLLKG